MKALTPMMVQYQDMKVRYPDAILFFRLGDFYEMFFEDAVEASSLLHLTLTARNKGEHKAPMCGIPYHAAGNYIAKLTRLGKKVAICEQLSDPNLPGIVKRDVVRVITPGTTLDDNVLEHKSNNFLVAIVEQPPHGDQDGKFGFACADVSTGQFHTTALASYQEFLMELERLRPIEAIVANGATAVLFKDLERLGIFWFKHALASSEEKIEDQASSLLLEYLKETQKTDLTHLQPAERYNAEDFMTLDEATLKNLELLSTLRENSKEGSLLWVLDETITSMGGRHLRYVITHPLLRRSSIEERLNAVEQLVQKPVVLDDIRLSLKNILDLERLLARLSLGHGNARDLYALKNSLQSVPTTRELLADFSAPLLQSVAENLHGLPQLVALLERAIIDEPPLAVKEGGMIREGFDSELDEIKNISREGKGYIQSLQEKEIARTKIGSLKIRYNSVFGYYIEISKANLHAVPQDYIRKQTMVNAERFITPELKEYEEKVLGAEEKIVALEYQIFQNLREKVVAHISEIQKLAQAIAQLDVLGSFSKVALQQRYCKPIITEDFSVTIQGGRHPVVEKMSFASKFVPNDVAFHDGGKLLLITGPNMGGKSTYLRQNALIVLMAHLGSFVPAGSAQIGLVDRIFTRVGASDNLMRGQSTFMVEMQETADILKNATARSLIILDEVGRGTSTYDGMSIAWAIVEYLHDHIGAKTLFATHYHELIALADKLTAAGNFSVAVRENETEGVVFLYKIVEGGVDRSYGIEVAKLAGMPPEVVEKAREILVNLES